MIVEIPDEEVEAYRDHQEHGYKLPVAVANGLPHTYRYLWKGRLALLPNADTGLPLKGD